MSDNKTVTIAIVGALATIGAATATALIPRMIADKPAAATPTPGAQPTTISNLTDAELPNPALDTGAAPMHRVSAVSTYAQPMTVMFYWQADGAWTSGEGASWAFKGNDSMDPELDGRPMMAESDEIYVHTALADGTEGMTGGNMVKVAGKDLGFVEAVVTPDSGSNHVVAVDCEAVADAGATNPAASDAPAG